MVNIIKETAKSNFGQDNIYQPLRDFKSETLGVKFEKLYAEKGKSTQNGKEKEVGINGLLFILAKMFRKKFLSYYIVLLLYRITLTIYQPLVFGKIVAHFRDPDPNIYYLGVALIVMNTVNFIIFQHFYQVCLEISIQIAITLSSAIYRKTVRLKIDNQEKLKNKVGNIVTLITKDVFAFELIIIFLADILIAAITISIQMVVIYQKIGWIGILTVAISLAMIAFGIIFGVLSQIQRSKECIYAAQRIDVLKDAFSLMEIVKMSVLENFFIKKCNEFRKKEIFHLLNVCFLRMTNMILGRLGSAVSFIITVLIYYKVNGDFSAEKLFFLSSSIDVIKSFFNFILPVGISRSGELIASLNRLKQYFSINDFSLDKSFASNNIYNVTADKPSIKINNLNIELNGKFIIKELNFEVLENCLVVVSGPVGSGKSTLLKAVIGEIETSPAHLSVKGSFSYASQDPWLFPGTIRQNILFGQDYNKDRYEEVVQRCALSYDFGQFENNDETLVIDDGVNLSKGQKMRINLARAIYQNKQIYLLDAVLNNIDAQTNKYIFQKVMKEFLKDKICIFVSDNPYHYQRADKVLCFASDSFSNIVFKDPATCELPSLENIIVEPNEVDVEQDSNEYSALLETNNLETNKNHVRYIYREQECKGNVRLSTYKIYARFCGGIWVILYLFIMFMIAQICIIISEKFMSIWINAEEKLYASMKNVSHDFEEPPSYKSVLNERNKSYQIFIVGFISNTIIYITASFSAFYICTRAAKKIHKSMVKSVMYSQMEFFCTTLLGTILNRFSKDINNIDEIMPTIIYNSLLTVFDCIGLFVMIALAQWIFLIPILIIVLAALVILKLILLPVITKAKRLETALHSPMVGYVNCTLNGLSTIRILGPNLDKLIREFDHYQDLFAAAFYITLCAERILKVFLQIACNILLTIVVFYFIISDNAKPGDVGLGIGKTLVVIRVIDYSLTRYMHIEAQLTSVERICEYLKLKQENRSGLSLSKDWKCNGNITIRKLNLTYESTNQHVLKNVNLSVKTGEKIAIVGRTGSGKSSLISCILRIYDYSGKIIINDVDIKGLDLNFLRSQFGVISQYTLVFSGSLRENIDPFKEHSDSEILLLISNLSKYFTCKYKQDKRIFVDILNSSINLDMQINKDMLSAGEKQIINLLRVLLSHRQIVFLDEFAEDLDEEANKAMHQIIEDYFQNCTVFFILHKFINLKNINKICVIQNGEVVEFDTPSNLLNKQKSEFRKMMDNSCY